MTVGTQATVCMAIPGKDVPGKVTVHEGGSSEIYIAYSDEPLEVGTDVAIYRIRGVRTLDVAPLYNIGE